MMLELIVKLDGYFLIFIFRRVYLSQTDSMYQGARSQMLPHHDGVYQTTCKSVKSLAL